MQEAQSCCGENSWPGTVMYEIKPLQISKTIRHFIRRGGNGTSHHFAYPKRNPFVWQLSASFYCHFQGFVCSFKIMPLHYLYIETTYMGGGYMIRRWRTREEAQKWNWPLFHFWTSFHIAWHPTYVCVMVYFDLDKRMRRRTGVRRVSHKQVGRCVAISALLMGRIKNWRPEPFHNLFPITPLRCLRTISMRTK